MVDVTLFFHARCLKRFLKYIIVGDKRLRNKRKEKLLDSAERTKGESTADTSRKRLWISTRTHHSREEYALALQ